MIAKYNSKSVALGIGGFGLQIGCLLAMILFAPGPGLVGTLLLVGMLVGQVAIIGAFCYYAVAKGYSAIFGALAMLSCVGLIIIACLPDRSRNEDS